MTLRLTESKDGTMRASLKVEFRITAYSLGEALLYIIDRNTEAHDEEAALAIIKGATRSQLLGGARQMFGFYGYTGIGEAALELSESVENKAYERARELFPEFAEGG